MWSPRTPQAEFELLAPLRFLGSNVGVVNFGACWTSLGLKACGPLRDLVAEFQHHKNEGFAIFGHILV